MGIWKITMEIIKYEIEDKENPEVPVRLRGACRSCPKK
jgi:Fe-S cluster biogenesis protein NfuA